MIARALIVLFGVSLAVSVSSAYARPIPEASTPPEPKPAVSAVSVEASTKTWTDEIERDFSLRSIGRLEISNLRGEVSVQGWALDKIRVKARRRAVAPTKEAADVLFAAVDFRYREFDGDIELSAEYGRDLSIEARIKERKNPQTSMDFIVFAPANLNLRVWSTSGQALVRSWRASAEIRTQTGEIRIEDMRGDQLTLACPQCPVSVESVQSSIRCVAGSGDVHIKDLAGKQVYIETNEGSQYLNNIKGEQLYLAKSGDIHGKHLNGHVEFHTQSGRVQIQESEGFVSGRTDSGPVSVSMLKWSFSDRALIETVRGDISLSLPSNFSGEVDLWSVHARTLLAFPLTPLDETQVYGPEPANHLRGRINGGSDQLRLYSQYGEVQILKGI